MLINRVIFNKFHGVGTLYITYNIIYYKYNYNIM